MLLFILSISLQASINSCRLIHIICIEQLSDFRGQTSYSGVFQEHFNTCRGFLYPDLFHLYKLASHDAFSKLRPFIDPGVEYTKCRCVLQLCNNFLSLFFPDEQKETFCNIPTIKFYNNKNISK